MTQSGYWLLRPEQFSRGESLVCRGPLISLYFSPLLESRTAAWHREMECDYSTGRQGWLVGNVLFNDPEALALLVEATSVLKDALEVSPSTRNVAFCSQAVVLNVPLSLGNSPRPLNSSSRYSACVLNLKTVASLWTVRSDDLIWTSRLSPFVWRKKVNIFQFFSQNIKWKRLELSEWCGFVRLVWSKVIPQFIYCRQSNNQLSHGNCLRFP